MTTSESLSAPTASIFPFESATTLWPPYIYIPSTDRVLSCRRGPFRSPSFSASPTHNITSYLFARSQSLSVLSPGIGSANRWASGLTHPRRHVSGKQAILTRPAFERACSILTKFPSLSPSIQNICATATQFQF